MGEEGFPPELHETRVASVPNSAKDTPDIENNKPRIVIVGAGFAGLWSAVGAARKLDELSARAEVVLVSPDAFHGIRVRFYEPELHDVRVALKTVLAPVGVKHLEGQVTTIDLSSRQIAVEKNSKTVMLPYSRLVLAAGSALHRPDIPGLEQNAHSVDTFSDAEALASHLRRLPRLEPSDGRFTAVVIGAGLTGIEVTCELVDRLRKVGGGEDVRVVLVDRSREVAASLGSRVRPVITEALSSLKIETRLGLSAESISADRTSSQASVGPKQLGRCSAIPFVSGICGVRICRGLSARDSAVWHRQERSPFHYESR